MKPTATFIVIRFFSLLLPILDFADQKNANATELKESKDKVYIPKVPEDYFSELNKLLRKEDIEKIRSGE